MKEGDQKSPGCSVFGCWVDAISERGDHKFLELLGFRLSVARLRKKGTIKIAFDPRGGGTMRFSWIDQCINTHVPVWQKLKLNSRQIYAILTASLITMFVAFDRELDGLPFIKRIV